MKAQDLRKLSAAELADRVREARDEVFDLRIKAATQQLEKSANLKRARRDLARALTVQAEQQKEKQ
jgi:large subunit ribosomal protein L29